MFNGNLFTRETEYHSFISDDLALEAIGMCTYTMSSMSGYLNPNNTDIVSYFDNKLDESRDALLALSEDKLSETYSIMRFDKSTKKYILATGQEVFKNPNGAIVESMDSISKLLTRHNEIQRGSEATEDEQEVIKNIQISLSGCITFRPKLSVLSCQRTPLVRLYIKNRTDNNTSRSLANNGPPMIVAVPNRVTGAAYSYHDSNLPLGLFSEPQHGGASNPANTVAAELKLTYNSALGKFESGTQQILARLLTTVDAAKISNLSGDDILEKINTAPPEDFIDPDADLFMGQFETGIALPLTSENGNPHNFGPNMVGCGGNNKKEKILVVNRSTRSFKAGDVVICSQIGKEWIIQGFDIPTTQDAKKPGLKVGKWSFRKWVANSSEFFRDLESKQYITPNLYENKFRYRYYLSLYPELSENLSQDMISYNEDMYNKEDIKKIALMNVYPAAANSFGDKEASLSQEIDAGSEKFKDQYTFCILLYGETSAFDQVNSTMGGYNDRVIFSRTNPYALNVDIGMFSMVQLAGFWGPIFPDGYNAQQCANFKISHPEIFNQEKSNHAQANEKILFDDESNDPHLYHLPAELATNGPFVENKLTSPLETFFGYQSATIYTNTNKSNFYTEISKYLKYDKRYFFSQSGDEPRYSLEPVNVNKITFIPLSLEMVTYNYDPTRFQSADSIPNAEYLSKYNHIKDMFLPYFYNNANMDIGIINMKKEYFRIGVDTYFDAAGPIGGPGILPDTESGNEKSNVVGIIGAKNTFTANGSITFTTRQYFGLKKVVQNALGQNSYAVDRDGRTTAGTSDISTYGYPQWGSYSDNYDSFGTTALHVRIFEAWPDEQTIYDSRLLAVFHFNPGSLEEKVDTDIAYEGISIDDWVKEDNVGMLNVLKYERSIDKTKYNVDFRIPTYGHPKDNEIDNKHIPVGDIINRNGGPNGPLRPESEWRVDTIRRGQLLTGGGFRHYRRVIGLNPTIIFVNRGSKYEKDQEFVLNKGAKIKITEVDSNGEIKKLSLIDKGVGFTPSDFASKHLIRNQSGDYGYLATIKANAGGTAAQMIFPQGIVYEKLYIDEGPLELTQNPVRLTLSSKSGNNVAEGENTVTISLDNTTKNKFDAFYLFHNDILHTISVPGLGDHTGGQGQYVTLEIGAG
jgi:hypothetical protein